MKRIILYTTLMISLMVSSCEILDVEPTTSWSGENLPTEEAHLEGLLYAGYERLQNALRTNFLVYGEMRADVFYNNAFNVNIDKVVNNSLDDGMSYASWRTFYEAVKQANLVLKFTPELVAKNIVAQADGDALMGQAYALRAFSYFYMVRIWGDVPLIIDPFLTKDDLKDLSRTPQAEVLNQIHLDLDQSVVLIPASANGRTTFTRTTAYAIDAHVYAWEHNYAKVIEKADKVLSNSNYALANLYNPSITINDPDFKTKVQSSEFAKIFNEGRSKESIFELAFSIDDGSDSQYLTSYLAGGFPYLRPLENFAGSFVDEDWRGFVSNELASNGKFKAIKFTLGFSADVDARNIVILRLGDIYLLKAEALAHLPGDTDNNRKAAMLLFNQIRERAGGPTFQIPEATFLDRQIYDADAFKALILEERKFELAYEGYRWFDLVRNGKAIEIIKERTGQILKPESLVWPIALEEIRRGNGIEQNEYYK